VYCLCYISLYAGFAVFYLSEADTEFIFMYKKPFMMLSRVYLVPIIISWINMTR